MTDKNILVKLFEGLAHPTRIMIMRLIFHSGSLTITELVSITGLIQQNIQRHIQYLKTKGLIFEVQSRQMKYWRISPATHAIIKYLILHKYL